MTSFDVIIIGSGIVGASAALALAKQASLLKIALLDSQAITSDWQPEKYDVRVSAISLASRRIFQNINVWEKIKAKRLSPYQRMHVWEEVGDGKIDFDCAEVYEPALGYIIEDSVMRASLYETLPLYPNISFLYPIKLNSLHQKPDGIELIAEDGSIYSAKLIIAADGANSWMRKQVGMQLKTYDYEHTAIVATVKTELPHHATAYQRFLKTGPLAFLPLSDEYTSSIVWSTLPAHAEELLALDDHAFQEALGEAFENRLGKMLEVDKRYHFPLIMRHVKNYVLPRIALIGDAAHTIHPLAGQGVNLGLLDAMSLVEVLTIALDKQRDFASVETLRRYERWRKGDNLAMLAMVESLKYLFMSDKTFFQTLRSLGLNFTDRVSFLKNFFAKYALGNRGDLPRIANKVY